ncbi:MAG: CapA family protein, partial [Lachnospiraceae bacterium]|nr:CapA family protein [Lachnospiraceae bacterium]
DKAIFYSLGNFVFDTDYQRSQYYTEYGIVLKINFTKDSFSFESMGIKTDREVEKVVKDRLPDIFTDISEGEYNLLLPLSAKAFLEATKRQQTYLYPDKYKNATEKDWHENFYEPLRSGRVPGEPLDLQIICPIAEKEKEKAWEKSKLEGVKEYILKMLDPIS